MEDKSVAYEEAPIGFSTREYEVAPAGYYDAQIVGVYNVGRHFDNYYQKYKPILKFRFEINHKDSEGRPIIILNDYNATMGAKAGLRKLAAAIEGRDLTDAEAQTWGISNFAGKQVTMCLSVETRKTDPTKKFNKIMAVMPMRPPGYVSENGFETWDYRNSDPDLAPNWIWKAYTESQDFRPPAKPRTPRPTGGLGEAVAASQTKPAPTAPGGEQLPWE